MDKKEIIISENESEEMMKIYIPNGFDRTGKKKEKVLFEGNYWDFNRDPIHLKEFLKKLFRELSIPITIKTDKKLKGEG